MKNRYLWTSASTMLQRFEDAPTLLGEEADGLIQSILRACGHEVVESGFVENHEGGVDCWFTAPMNGRVQRIGVEVKYQATPVDLEAVRRALLISKEAAFDRTWVIARSGFAPAALRLAEGEAPGVVDLLDPAELRSWVTNKIIKGASVGGSAAIIRDAMRALARRIAAFPAELQMLEWRDLERVLREVFEGIGFATHLTRPGKDGGFDLELSAQTKQGKKSYLVEVKHWTTQKPGASHLTKLIRISIEREVESALLLSTSGFTRTIHAGLLEIGPPVRLGAADKMVALCRAYSRLSTGYWLEESLLDTLFTGTTTVVPLAT